MMVIIGSWHRRRSLSRLEPLFFDYFLMGTLFLEYLGLSLFLDFRKLARRLANGHIAFGAPPGQSEVDPVARYNLNGRSASVIKTKKKG